MKHWTHQRRLSFWIHTGIVTVPFTFSTISAAVFWYGLFQSAVIALAMVTVVDMLALLGLILYIMRIASPFQSLRHVLPVISVVPLGLELWSLLASNGAWIAGAITGIVITIMVYVAWQCFTTIERLFIPPLQAAREKAEQDVQALVLTMEQLRVVTAAVDVFRSGSASQMTVVERSTLNEPAPPLSKTQQVKLLASELGVSESTIWRRMQSGAVRPEGDERG